VVWYENLGGGNFGGEQTAGQLYGAVSVYTTDLDGDTNPDVLSAASWDDEVAWYRSELPFPADTDTDGVCDASDLCPGFPDDGLDTDGDGIPNNCDACLAATDLDGDGWPDDCDICPGFPDDDDADLDGVPTSGARGNASW